MNNDGEDVRYERATITTRETCESCGGAFDAQNREAGEDGSGRPVLQLLTRECLACTELGAKPPECLVCGDPLSGAPCGGDPVFECMGCESSYTLEDMRSLLLGRAVSSVLEQWSTDYEALAREVLRQAAAVGVVRGG